MTDALRSRAARFREVTNAAKEDQKRGNSAVGSDSVKDLQRQIHDLNDFVAKVCKEQTETKQNLAEEIQKRQKERQEWEEKSQEWEKKGQEWEKERKELKEEVDALKKTVTDLTKEVNYFKNKFHLSQRRNFWQMYIHAVLTEMDFKPEEIDRASAGELWNMLTKEMYATWRAASKAREQLPTYAQMEAMMPTVLAEGNAAVHTSQMMELFDELSITGPNTVMYEPMWDYLADDAEWMKWSALVEAKKQQQQPDQI